MITYMIDIQQFVVFLEHNTIYSTEHKLINRGKNGIFT